MLSALPYGICLFALLSQFLLAISLRQLRAGKGQILAVVSLRRIRFVTTALLGAPVVAAAAVAGLNLFVFPDPSLMRVAHSTFSMGLWLVLVMAFVMLLLLYRLHRSPSIESLAAPLVSVPLAAYLTPYARFTLVYAETGPFLPLMVGAILVATAYLIIGQVRRELL